MIAWVDKNEDGIMQYRAGDVFTENLLMMIQPDRMVLLVLVTNEISPSLKMKFITIKTSLYWPTLKWLGLPQWVIVMAGCVL